MLDEENKKKNSQGFALNPQPAARAGAGRDGGRSLSIRVRSKGKQLITTGVRLNAPVLFARPAASAALTGSALRRQIVQSSRFALF